MSGAAGIFGAGFFSNAPVHTALALGAVVAVVSALVGTFTVMRGQSFAGHALADIGSAGGAGAVLAGVPPLYGFLAVNLLAAALMDAIGLRSVRARDLATGIVLGAALGLTALFLYEDTVSASTGATTVNVLFGSIFTASGGTIPIAAGFGGLAAGIVAVLYRPLLLSSVSLDLAVAQGVPVRRVAIAHLLAVAIAVSLSALTIGAVLSTALLIGPAAAALRLSRRTGAALALAAGIGLAAVWLGILLAYDSVSWTGGRGWPASFCIVAVVLGAYLLAAALSRLRAGRTGGRAA